MEKMIVIEGLDGSGKSTQAEILQAALTGAGTAVRRIKLPDYDSPSSTLVKMYLAGDFGSDPQDVNAYAASAFYAVDRFASYQNSWKADYMGGKLILADRYTTSNAVHQMVKLPKDKWDEYLAWLEDFEYVKIGLPKPSLVIYLDVPVEISQKLMTSRYSGDDAKKDVHESNVKYLKSCRQAALYAAKKLDWRVVACSQGDTIRPIDDIGAELIDLVKKEVL